MDETSRLNEDIDNWNYEMIFPEEESPHYPSDQQKPQHHEKNFEQYDGRPFSAFKDPSKCEKDPDEVIFGQFKEWLLTCRTEGFLYTFEPKPTLTHLTIGKCPYMHTGLTCEEQLAQLRKAEQDERMKQELEEFVRKRLRLIQKLLLVYKKAKKGIEDEYLRNLSKKDPYCDYKRRASSKRIVDMMIKQFALEYLYLKSLKVKKEIETIHCYLIDTDRTRHLRNIHKYTLRTAEKLRLLLEKECNEDSEEPETYFEEDTLKDMARMYLNEIENMTASVPYFTSDDWSSEHFWEETSSSGGIPPDYEALSDIIENKFLHEEFAKGSEATSEKSMTVENTGIGSDKEESADAESKAFSDEEEKISSKKFESLSEVEEDIFKTDLEPEGSLDAIEEIKREILKPFYSLQDEDAETVVSEAHEEKSDEELKKLVQLELNRAEIELLEEFKRELWLMDCFNFYTTKIRPDLHGKLKLVHERSIYNKLLEQITDTDETSTIETESSIDSNLNDCLLYLNNHSKRVPGTTKDTSHRTPNKQSDPIQLGSFDSQSPRSHSQQFVLPDDESSDQSSQEEIFSAESVMKQSLDALPYGQEMKHLSQYSAYSRLDKGSSMIRSSALEMFRIADYQHLSKGYSTGSIHFLPKSSSITPSYNYGGDPSVAKVSMVSYDDGKSYLSNGLSNEDVSLISRGSSIPSFSGSLPDPLKIYEKCIKEREEEAASGNIGRFESLTLDQITMRVGMDRKRSDESESNTVGSLLSGLTKMSRTSASTNKSKQQDMSDSTDSESRNSRAAGDARSPEQKAKKCFPTLIEVMDHFTKSLKGEPTSSVETSSKSEPSIAEEEIIPVDWSELINLKWSCPVQKRAENKPVECDFDTAPYIDKLRKSNKQYMNNHPEMSAIISLILREISMKRPQNEFVAFIRNTLFDKNFAKKLTSYLTVNNKAYRRRNGIDLNECGRGLSTQSHNMFDFDLPSSQYWKTWGVDYTRMSEKFGPKGDGFVCPERESSVTEGYKDPWDLDRILKECAADSRRGGKERHVCGGWTKMTSSLAQREATDLRREQICVTALANDLDWGEPPDLRSSCQKLFTKRILVDRDNQNKVKK